MMNRRFLQILVLCLILIAIANVSLRLTHLEGTLELSLLGQWSGVSNLKSVEFQSKQYSNANETKVPVPRMFIFKISLEIESILSDTD